MISGPDHKLIVWLLETSQLLLKIWEKWVKIIAYIFIENIYINQEVIYRFSQLIFSWLVNYEIT